MQTVVIIGGGGAGALIARSLSQQLESTKYSIVLVESREYYLHYPGTLRMLVSNKGSLEDRVLMPYDHLFNNKNGKIVQSAAVSVIPNRNGKGGRVVTENGQEHPYAALVFATGTIFDSPLNFPASKSDAIQHIEEWRDRFRRSKGVAIIGGGPVGCELAGELRDVYPDKKITIVHKEGHLLMPIYPEKYRTDVEKRWRERKISLVLNDEVNAIPDFPSTGTSTAKGLHIDADLIVPTWGGRPNTSLVMSLGPELLTPSGRVKVEGTLLIKGYQDIFAVGDIIDWSEVKQVAKYTGHSATVVSNIKSILEGRQPSTVYKSMFEVIALNNGSDGGAVYMDTLWGLRFGNTFAKMIKAKDLFITKTLQGLGVDM